MTLQYDTIQIPSTQQIHTKLKVILIGLKNNHPQNHPDKLRGDVKSVILEVIKEVAISAGSKDEDSFMTDEEREQLVKYVAESIKTITLKKVGKENRI